MDALGPHVADDVERPRRGVGVIAGRQFVDELVEVNLHRLLAQLIHHLPEGKSMPRSPLNHVKVISLSGHYFWSYFSFKRCSHCVCVCMPST